jgi:nitrilase
VVQELFLAQRYWANRYPPLKQVNALIKYAEESVAVEPNGEDLSALQDACRRTGVAINLGDSERVANGHTLFNSQVIIDSDGTILGVHSKLRPTYVERMVWVQGNGSMLRNWPLSLSYKLGGLVR